MVRTTGVAGERLHADLTSDEERWAEALAVERTHGAAAPRHVAERLGALAITGDQAGIVRWQAIATKLDALRRHGPAS